MTRLTSLDLNLGGPRRTKLIGALEELRIGIQIVKSKYHADRVLGKQVPIWRVDQEEIHCRTSDPANIEVWANAMVDPR
jgi:hypothetical protein